MPRKKQSAEVSAVQVVFRVPRDLHDALLTAASGLGLDLSNLLRLVLTERLPEYLERGRQAAAALEQARVQPQQARTGRQQARQAQQPEPTFRGRGRRPLTVETNQS
jgi:hypothetical protein